MSLIKQPSHQIDILLGTYQGELYLKELLESILCQTYQDFQILIRDDLSTDKTKDIIQTYQRKFPQKILIIPSETNIGVKKNFSELLKYSQAPYVMFADQDDYWLPNKIQMSLKELKELEKKFSKNQPLLVHTDLTVVNKDLEIIAPSFWKFVKINPFLFQLNRLLTQNIFTGCTLLFNRALVKMSFPIPDEAIMHDWWIGLIACCFGSIGVCSEPTILYRQHCENQLGAKKYSLAQGLKRMKKIKKTESSFNQADSFLQFFNSELQYYPKQAHLIKNYSRLKSLPYLQQKYFILKYKFFKHGLLRNLKNFLLKTVD